MIDVFSRYIVGWLLVEVESAELAQHLVSECCRKQNIEPQQLTIHSDRGAVMMAKSLAQLFSDLGVDPSHSRPYTPDDNPFSESQFKTMKYRPDWVWLVAYKFFLSLFSKVFSSVLLFHFC